MMLRRQLQQQLGPLLGLEASQAAASGSAQPGSHVQLPLPVTVHAAALLASRMAQLVWILAVCLMSHSNLNCMPMQSRY